MGHVCLLSTVELLILGNIKLRNPFFINIFAFFASIEPKARAIPYLRPFAEKALVPFDPVMDYAELSRLVVEETVHVSSYDLVDVKKERWA